MRQEAFRTGQTMPGAVARIGHAELLEPVRNQLHCSAPSGRRYPIKGLQSILGRGDLGWRALSLGPLPVNSFPGTG